MSIKRSVIIVAGGSGTRMNSAIPKQFLLLAGKPVLMHTIFKFYIFDNNIDIILVLPENQITLWKDLCNKYNFLINHTIVKGGNTRFYSVKNGLNQLKYDCTVGIHDGVRPLVSLETIKVCFETSKKKGNAIPAIPVNESVRVVEKFQSKNFDRSKLKIIQTPQCFDSKIILKAFQQDYNEMFTDDATVVEYYGENINLVDGNFENIKITTPNDLIYAEALLKNQNL